jgi:hypothetical protein
MWTVELEPLNENETDYVLAYQTAATPDGCSALDFSGNRIEMIQWGCLGLNLLVREVWTECSSNRSSIIFSRHYSP